MCTIHGAAGASAVLVQQRRLLGLGWAGTLGQTILPGCAVSRVAGAQLGDGRLGSRSDPVRAQLAVSRDWQFFDQHMCCPLHLLRMGSSSELQLLQSVVPCCAEQSWHGGR